MYSEHDDELEFWSRVDGPRTPRPTATRRARAPRPATARRRPVTAARPSSPSNESLGRRTHRDDTGPITRLPSLTGAIPVIAQRARRAGAAADPRVRRVGILALVVVLAVPVALALRSSNEADATAPADLPRFSAASFAATTTAATAATTTLATAPAANTAVAPAEPPVTTAAGSPWAEVDVNALPAAVPKHPAATATAETDPAPPTTVAAAPKAAAATKTVVNVSACSKQYTVRAGDAWTLIATRVNVSAKALFQANNATAATMLYPGRSICLPLNASLPSSSSATKPAASKPAASKPSSSGSTTANTLAPRPANTYTRAQVEAIIRSVWPDSLEDEAVRIATRESNLNPTVRNYCCYGLFQLYYSVHRSWLATVGVHSAADLYDPKMNALAAYTLYLRSGGFRPWQ